MPKIKHHTLATADIRRINGLRTRPIALDEDNPPLTTTQLARVVRHRGRPRGSQKTRLTIRLDWEIVAWLKRGGVGYQTRLNRLLRQAMVRAERRG